MMRSLKGRLALFVDLLANLSMPPFPFPPEVSRPVHFLNRRSFLASTAAAIPLGLLGQSPSPSTVTSETLASQLHGSLDETQRRLVCREFNDPLRQKVDNNWMITGRSIQDVLRPDQQDLVRQIFRKLHHPNQQYRRGDDN
jgi:hypothetical protein